MSGLIWPDAEGHLARAAAVQTSPMRCPPSQRQSPEDLAPHLGAEAWFQLYPPRDEAIRRDMLQRARDAGFGKLVLTVDVPVASRRERQTRSGLTSPPKTHAAPAGAGGPATGLGLGMARRGMPQMRMLDKYADATTKGLSPTAHVGLSAAHLAGLGLCEMAARPLAGRSSDQGRPAAPKTQAPLEATGVDALWVSNHAGRQFDAAPATIDVLPSIRAATRLPLIFDSGVEGGLDILRALASGADFVMLGRAFHYALAALGPVGIDHLIDMLAKDMAANMGQLGARTLGELPAPFQLR